MESTLLQTPKDAPLLLVYVESGPLGHKEFEERLEARFFNLLGAFGQVYCVIVETSSVVVVPVVEIVLVGAKVVTVSGAPT